MGEDVRVGWVCCQPSSLGRNGEELHGKMVELLSRESSPDREVTRRILLSVVVSPI